MEVQGTSDFSIVFVWQGGSQTEPGPGSGSESASGLDEEVLHVCLERADQLELWLQEAQRMLGKATTAKGSEVMQESLEWQLLSCQVRHAAFEQGDGSNKNL